MCEASCLAARPTGPCALPGVASVGWPLPQAAGASPVAELRGGNRAGVVSPCVPFD